MRGLGCGGWRPASAIATAGIRFGHTLRPGARTLSARERRNAESGRLAPPREVLACEALARAVQADGAQARIAWGVVSSRPVPTLRPLAAATR